MTGLMPPIEPDIIKLSSGEDPVLGRCVPYSFLCTQALGGVSLKQIFVSPPRVLH